MSLAANEETEYMDLQNTHYFEMLTRVHDFGLAHADLFPATTAVGQAFASVGTALEELSQHASVQVAGHGAARGDVTTKGIARRALYEHVAAISHTARSLALDTPGLDDRFRMPRERGDQALLAAGRAFAQEVGPLADAFVGHGLPKTFVADLEASIDAFETAAHEHETSKDVHVGARASLEHSLEAGLVAVKRLDSIMPNYLGSDPALRALWARARHVERPRSAKAATAEAAAPQPAGPAASTTSVTK